MNKIKKIVSVMTIATISATSITSSANEINVSHTKDNLHNIINPLGTPKYNALHWFTDIDGKPSIHILTKEELEEKARQEEQAKIEEQQRQEEQERQGQIKKQKATQKYVSRAYTNNNISEEDAKESVAKRESGGDYDAVSKSGKYIGKYQLDSKYLNGDYSQENQETTANNYVTERYGSWSNAYDHQNAYGWY